MKTIITKQVEIDLTVDEAAEWFAALDDDSQARFFVKVAEKMSAFKGGMDSQLYFIGGHLQHCECSTPQARELVKSLAYFIDNSPHGKKELPI